MPTKDSRKKGQRRQRQTTQSPQYGTPSTNDLQGQTPSSGKGSTLLPQERRAGGAYHPRLAHLDVDAFGRKLLETRDLDPVYVLLHTAGFSRDLALCSRWLLAYWSYYDIGTASWIAEHEEPHYWRAFCRAARSAYYPRGKERRHYRGQIAVRSSTWLRQQGIDRLFGPLLTGEETAKSLVEVLRHVQGWIGFGPWIGFKASDMLERLGLARVRFPPESVFALYSSPLEGAARLWRQETGKGEFPADLGLWAVRRVLRGQSGRKAPPREDRPLNVQEAETILCKWEAHTRGRYHVGEDIAACRRSLARFGRSRLVQRLYRAGKLAGLW